jgi:hypothetical protein
MFYVSRNHSLRSENGVHRLRWFGVRSLLKRDNFLFECSERRRHSPGIVLDAPVSRCVPLDVTDDNRLQAGIKHLKITNAKYSLQTVESQSKWGPVDNLHIGSPCRQIEAPKINNKKNARGGGSRRTLGAPYSHARC